MMKAKLQIKNFGPIKDIDIEISKFNILIGPHASGKSTISKVLCVIHAFADYFSPGYRPFREKFLSDEVNTENGKFKLLIELLNFYRIEKYLTKTSFYIFEDDHFSFKFDGTGVEVNHKEKQRANRSPNYYIPAERIALPMISESLFEITLEQSTLPRYFLQFGRDFTIARNEQNIFNIPLLNIEFEHKDGKNVVNLRNSQSLLLEETSSAIQANLPLLIILQYPVKKASMFVIEELELHGFPNLQKELLPYVIKKMRQGSLANGYLMLPTHSPYILSIANNLLFAAKVGKQSSSIETEANKIIKKESWIDEGELSAYYIKNGKADSILDNKTGLIYENQLDGISEDLAGEFDALMDLYKPAIA